jgi:hypothetical protein
VIFGRHIDIEVSYKILWLEVPKLVPILHYSACFQKGCLEAILSKNTLNPLGVKCGKPTILVHFFTHTCHFKYYLSKEILSIENHSNDQTKLKNLESN